VIDLEALEKRPVDRHTGAVLYWGPEVLPLIAELRAARKVVEAADKVRYVRGNFSAMTAEQRELWREIDTALAEYEALAVKP
jgi:hypothetical protein